MTPPRPKPDARNDAILRAALDVFLECGVPGASIEAIRRRSGASTGSLYHRFAGKEAIAAAVYLDALSAYQKTFLRALAAGGSTEATVRAIVRMHLHWVEEHADEAEFLMSGLDATIRRGAEESLRGLNQPFFAELRAWITPRQERGELLAAPFEVLHALWLGPSQELARQWFARDRGGPPLRSAAGPLAGAAWRTLRSDLTGTTTPKGSPV